jgi:aryl sulfotransferase
MMPVTSRVYQHHSLDSTRWKWFEPRDGDVVVASSYKSGTTWVQLIVLQLLGFECHDIDGIAPWLESPATPIERVLEELEARTTRRVIKTHLPLDALPYHNNIRYLVVCRDGRDVFMSLWNHYQQMVRYPFLSLRKAVGRVGPPLPRCPSDIREFWRDWITQGWFSWEREGYPFWGNLRHTATWWEWRHLSNIHFLHFNDLLVRPAEEIRLIARHIDAKTNCGRVADVVEGTTFANVKANASTLLPRAEFAFRGGAGSFIFQGSIRRWIGVLDEKDLELYSIALRRETPTECATWLAHERS